MSHQQFYQRIKSTFSIVFIFALLMSTLILTSIFLLDYIKPNGLMAVDNKDTLIINNVNIVSVITNQIVKNRQLVINKGIITAISETNSPITSIARVIDGKGAYVTPGLFDMHVHLYDRKYLMLNLAYGVTSVRNLNGKKMHLRWKQELQNDEWLGSNMYVSSPILAGVGTHVLNQQVLSPKEGRQQVREAQSKGYDLIKMYGYLSADIFEAIIDEAKNINIAVAKHGPHPAKGADWSNLKDLQSLEHVEDIFQGPLNYQFDHNKLQLIAKKIKALNVPIVPTLETFKHLTELSKNKDNFINTLSLDYLNPLHYDIESRFTVNRWLKDTSQQSAYHVKKLQFLLEIVKALNDHQVKILVGSDAGTMYTLSGIATHNEMQLLKQSGLSNFEVLKAATINAAQALEIDHEYGSVDVGKVADLILVTNNPLDDIGRLKSPFAVIKNGQWLDEAKLKALKISAKDNDNYFWSFINLVEDLLTRAIF
ncbi:MAG: amidohydrolase family protein [Colwellia sp.]|nr:amidohydrolase family protein [Colwellia sp.]